MNSRAHAESRPAAPRLRHLTWSGLMVVALSIVLLRLQPGRMVELPAGMVTPVLALELARTPGEVENAFGKDANRRAAFQIRMIRGTWVDYGLLVSYAVFLGGVALAFAREGSREARVALAFAPLAACCDAVENGALLWIFSHLDGDYSGALSMLGFATWGKWLLLSAYFAALSPALFRSGGFLRVAAVTGGIGAAAALIAVALRGIAAEVMLNGISIAIAALVVACYRQKLPA